MSFASICLYLVSHFLLPLVGELQISEGFQASLLPWMGIQSKCSLKSSNHPAMFTLGFNEYQMSKLKSNEAFTTEREREITQVVKSVNKLAQIMKDLSVLVIDQGIEEMLEHSQGTAPSYTFSNGKLDYGDMFDAQ